MRAFSLLLTASALAAGVTTAVPGEFFEGLWAKSARECPDTDKPTSRLFIDLTNTLNGKNVPLYDGYEHHCRIGKIVRQGTRAKLSMNCHEFTDDYLKNVNGVKETVVASASGNTLRLDGKRYVRCPLKR